MLFYTQLFTSKRGPLAKIWLAAHWERKLTKAHVFECNLEESIQDIISPKMKIGLRTSGHLLLGVVRIYSRKAKYLFADCGDALVRMKMAFRPGQVDMPVEGLEATLDAITLVEEFTPFDAQLPSLSDIDVVDHFSLNQGRTEEITLREDFGNDTLTLMDTVEGESTGHQTTLLDMSFHSLAQQGDAFGDEDRESDLLDFLTNSSDHIESTIFISEEPHLETPENFPSSYQPDVHSRDPVEGETPALNETCMLRNKAAFALEPVMTTPNSQVKRAKRKRKLVVDKNKELSNAFIREQLSDYSDLIVSLDTALPSVQLMQSGGADRLFAQTCSSVVSPQIKEVFAKSVFPVKSFCEEGEEMRQDRYEVQQDLSAHISDDINVMDSSSNTEKANNAEQTALNQLNNDLSEDYSNQDQNPSEFFYPELPSEDSMFVHPSRVEPETQSTLLHTQVRPASSSELWSFSNTQSMLDSQDFEERRISKRAHTLLNRLKSSGDTTFSIETLCEGINRSQAATTFFCLLVLKKEGALQLHQSAPYEDICVTTGPKYYNL